MNWDILPELIAATLAALGLLDRVSRWLRARWQVINILTMTIERLAQSGLGSTQSVIIKNLKREITTAINQTLPEARDVLQQAVLHAESANAGGTTTLKTTQEPRWRRIMRGIGTALLRLLPLLGGRF